MKDPIISKRWVVDMESAKMTSLYPEGLKVKDVACLLRDQARDWWEKVIHALGVSVVGAMTRTDFMTRFRAKFAPAMEV